MLKHHFVKYAQLIISQNIGNRELVFFGKNTELLERFRSQGFVVHQIFTVNYKAVETDQSGMLKKAAFLKDHAKDYYVFCPTRYGKNEEMLNRFGFEKYKDYLFYTPERVTVSELPYQDGMGNRVTGNLKNVSLIIEGYGNQISLEGISVSEELKILCVGSDNKLTLNKTKCFQENLIKLSGNNNTISIGNGYINQSTIRTWGNSEIIIGDHTTIEERTDIVASLKSVISIGKDCMVARDVVIQAGDGHVIYDTVSGKPINKAVSGGINNQIRIHDHV